jgi:asparagine synthase (glutamine-hydrolysing)
VPAPWSIYRGVRKLEPGAWVRCAAGRADEHGRWWRIDEAARHGLASRTETAVWTDTEATDRLEALLLQAVRSQLLADVPLGAFLSGGVDSSTVVAMMVRGARTVRTLPSDSTSRVRRAGHACRGRAPGTEHRASRPAPMHGRRAAPAACTTTAADSSQIRTALVTAMARHAAVALSGDGGDSSSRATTTIADRLWHRTAACRWRCGASPREPRWASMPAPGSWPTPAVGRRGRHAEVGPLPLALRAADADAGHASRAGLTVARARDAGRKPEPPSTNLFDGPDGIDRMCLLDQHRPDDILVKVDRGDGRRSNTRPCC